MIIDRIYSVIEYSEMSQTAFAKRIGSTQANLWRQLNGQKLNASILVAIAEQFPEISCSWLLKGEGSMLEGLDDSAQDQRIDNLVDVISMQQEIIRNLQEKIKQLQNK